MRLKLNAYSSDYLKRVQIYSDSNGMAVDTLTYAANISSSLSRQFVCGVNIEGDILLQEQYCIEDICSVGNAAFRWKKVLSVACGACGPLHLNAEVLNADGDKLGVISTRSLLFGVGVYSRMWSNGERVFLLYKLRTVYVRNVDMRFSMRSENMNSAQMDCSRYHIDSDLYLKCLFLYIFWRDHESIFNN